MSFYVNVGKKTRINVFGVFGAVPLWLINGTDCMFIMIAGALTHELAHMAAIKCGKGIIKRIDVGFLGAEIIYSGEKMTFAYEMANSLAGVTANIVLSGISFVIFKTHGDMRIAFFSLCNAVLAAVNLLPVRGLDGYNALYNVLQMKYDANKSYLICRRVSKTASAVTAAATLFVLIETGMNTSLLLLCMIASVLKKSE